MVYYEVVSNNTHSVMGSYYNPSEAIAYCDQLNARNGYSAFRVQKIEPDWIAALYAETLAN